MPSLYEPSGLNQLYSLNYGTPPVVRATGGLADTVVDTTPETLANGTATGFSFQARTPASRSWTRCSGPGPVPRQPRRWRQLLQQRHAPGLVVGPQCGGVRTAVPEADIAQDADDRMASLRFRG